MAVKALCAVRACVGNWKRELAERQELSGEKDYAGRNGAYSPRILDRSGQLEQTSHGVHLSDWLDERVMQIIM